MFPFGGVKKMLNFAPDKRTKYNYQLSIVNYQLIGGTNMKKIFTLALMTVMTISANALSFTLVSSNNNTAVVLSSNDVRPVYHRTVVAPAPRVEVVRVKPVPPHVKHHKHHVRHHHAPAPAPTWRDAAVRPHHHIR